MITTRNRRLIAILSTLIIMLLLAVIVAIQPQVAVTISTIAGAITTILLAYLGGDTLNKIKGKPQNNGQTINQ
jgi:membrane protein implicated in regulation of membrane protease activity